MSKSLTIIIPAYNEEKALETYIPHVINHCNKMQYKLIITNDGSKDRTGEILKKWGSENNLLKVITHKINKGYGAAIKSGVKAADTDYIVTIDADGQHHLGDIDRLFLEIQESDADMIVGSRKGLKSSSKYRALGKRLIRIIAKSLMTFNIYDINSGMKMYNTRLAQKYYHLCPNGMSYSDVITLVFIHFRHKVIESPITINLRIAGQSTVNIKTAVETMKEILNIVILFNPIKVFSSISLFTLIISLAWGIPIIIAGKGLSAGTSLGIVVSVLLFFIGLLAEQISEIRKSKLNDEQQ